MIYEGPYANRLRRLRRLSVASSIIGGIGFPVTYVFGIPNSAVSMAGQIAIMGTTLFASLSSTAFLALVTHSYVTHLHELQPVPKDGQRRFRASRINMWGNPIVTEFTMADISKVTTSQNPYATCQAKKDYMYFHGKEMHDPNLRIIMTNDSHTYSQKVQ